MCDIARNIDPAPPLAVLPLAAPDVALDEPCTPYFSDPIQLDPFLADVPQLS